MSKKTEESKNLDRYLYRPYIKTVCLLLPDYTYRHTTDIEDQKNFVGRDDAKSKLKAYLFNSIRKGSYLITGYRGMGKTSLVNGVLQDDELKKRGYERINISFGQKNITELDILRQCVFEIKNKIEKKPKNNIISALTSPYWAIGIGTFLISFFYGILTCPSVATIFLLSFFIILLPFIAWFSFKEICYYIAPKKLEQWRTKYYKIWVFARGLAIVALIGATFYLFEKTNIIDITSKIENFEPPIADKAIDKMRNFHTLLIKKLGLSDVVLPKENEKNPKYSIKDFLDINVTLSLIVLFAIVSAFIAILMRVVTENIVFRNFKLVTTKVQFLYDRCSSNFTTEESSGTGAEQFPIILSKRRQKSYPIAGAKEISNELINLLSLIYKKLNLHFVFVFDELDKIDSTLYNVPLYEDTEMLDMKGETISYNEHRKRKKLVLDILSSLKYLITEADAKFVFIAGSEMFDAALADVSDRHSAISSIFGHIINVDSFYKDKAKNVDVPPSVGITSLIETYLIKIIDPAKKNKEKSSILNFDWNIYGDHYQDEDKLKIIFTIQHFITYLAYRSTGAPKKMIRLIEEHISGERELSDHDKVIHCSSHKDYTIGKNKLYLTFTYNEQYKMGLLNYFYRPIILSRSRTMKNYSNSLLVAIPYLMDHIIKFHGSAFSMENLELLPEVLAPNRNPELRLFLEELIELFKQNLLRETDTKFFDYKFNTKIVNEIIHASTIFAEESAAFNFTLDENYNIKVYLRLKIKELRNIYQHFGGGDKSNILDSIALFNSMLGDVSYYDREYSDSIGAYSDALNALKTIDDPVILMPLQRIKPSENFELANYHFASYIRILMKLALTYEKIKSYQNAMGCYQDVIDLVRHNKLLERDTVGDAELTRMLSNAFFAQLFLIEKKPSLGYYNDFFEGKYKDIIEHIYKKNPAGFLNNLSLLFYYRNEDIVKNFRGKKNKNPLFEVLQGLKVNADPVSDSCITSATLLKTALTKLSNEDSFENSLTYLKEGYFNKDLKKNEAFQAARMLSRYGNCLYSKFPSETIRNKGETKEQYNDRLSEVINMELKNLIKSMNNSGMGVNTQDIASNKIKDWIKSVAIDSLNSSDSELLSIFYIYTLSAKLYLYSGHSIMGGHQYRKMLSILRNFASELKALADRDQKIVDTFLGVIQHTFVKRSLQIASWNSSSTDRGQVYKYNFALEIDTIYQEKYLTKYNYHSTSNASDIKETLWHFIALKEICFPTQCSVKNVIEKNANQSFVNPSAVLHTMMARMNELSVQCVINKSLYNNLKGKIESIENSVGGPLYDSLRNRKKGGKLFISVKEEDLEHIRELPYIVANWLFCLNNILLIMQTKGNSFLITFSTLADQYRRIGDVLKYYELCKVLHNERPEKFPYKVKELTEGIIGQSAIQGMDTTSMYQIATRNYRLAIDAHKRGSSYRYLISNMFYLEDDFHDNLNHFTIAFERQKINTEVLLEQCRTLNKELSKSSFFDYEYHVNSDELKL